jgi:hypothetical protein
MYGNAKERKRRASSSPSGIDRGGGEKETGLSPPAREEKNGESLDMEA